MAVPALSKGLSHEALKIRKSSAQILGRLGPRAKAAIPALVKALKDPKPSVRDAAIDALQIVVLTPLPKKKEVKEPQASKPQKNPSKTKKKKKRSF